MPDDPPRQPEDEAEEEGPGGSLKPLPEIMRRAIATGLSGFFLTEEAVRRAIGDTLPKDWADFAVDQSDQIRADLMDRLAIEMRRAFESVDPAEVINQLLDGRTVEIKAEFRLKPDEEDAAKPSKSRTSRD